MSHATLRVGLALLLVMSGAASARADDPPLGPQADLANEVLASPDFGEDESDSLAGLEATGRRRPRLRLRVLQDFTPDQDHDGADVDTYTTTFHASIGGPVTESLALRLSGRLEATQTDFRGDESFLDTGRTRGDPFEELFVNRYRLDGRYRINDEWSLLGSAQLRSSWERGADYGSGIQGSGILAVGYLFRERLSLVAGVRASSRLARDDVRFRPIVHIGWQVTDDLEIETRNLGLRVSYRLRDGVKLFTFSQWKQKSYRLEDRGGNIGKGLIQNRTVPAVAGISWKPSKRFRLRAHAGAIAYQRYTVRDDDRNKTDREVSDGAAFTGRLDLRFRF